MNTSFNVSDDNLIGVLVSLIKRLKIPVSTTTIEKELTNHPKHPSLLTISDCLTKWKIPHEIYKLQKTDVNFEELYYPFLAHLEGDEARIILVQSVENDKLSYYDEKNRKCTMPLDHFLNLWSGVIVYAEKDKTSGEREYLNSTIEALIKKLSFPVLISVLFLLVCISIIPNILHLSFLGVLISKALGIVVTSLLLIYSVNKNNKLVRQICSINKESSCNSILSSPSSKVFSWLSWAEVGWFYFSGSFFCMVIAPESLNFLRVLNIACLPFTFYSLIYQINLKQWCFLCCSVLVILWSEFLFFNFPYQAITINFGFLTYLKIVLSFLFPLAFWYFLKPFFQSSIKKTVLDKQLKLFKNNYAIFNAFLKSQNKLVTNDLEAVTLGNPVADTIITMVSNPFCGPCASAHRQLEDWISERNDIQLRVIFATKEEANNTGTEVAKHFLALNRLSNKDVLREALNDWYSNKLKDYGSLREKYPVVLEPNLDKVSDLHKAWCKAADVLYTPTILINGYKLEQPYQIADVKYML
ncbi:vitamin K epoxide reductase family protein [Olivibacter domesticus]|uniref:Thioredoxin n=1 Tax=Olivibacter domesticus TaxID=407022 RepID=A0A1H7JQB6_OLID1|nr:vitamin K epoxide reductase family protein [Olivibacter domesticus]SEK76841.1 Thioredoxin [Olivibacter domesticus]